MSRKTLVFESVTENLMRLTGKRNLSQLGRWLYENDKTSSSQYFSHAKCEGYGLNYEKIVKRCLKDGLDLNAVFGNERIVGGVEGKLNAAESQVRELLEQVKGLHADNKKYMDSLHKLNMEFNALSLKYVEQMNPKR